MTGVWFAIIRISETFLSIIALALSGFVAGWPTFSTGGYYGSAIALYYWPGWFACATAAFMLIAMISILAAQRGTALSLGRSVAVLVIDILIFIFLIISVAGFANVFVGVLSSRTNSGGSTYNDYDDYYNSYSYPSYGYTTYRVSEIEIAWSSCVKADMAILVVLLVLSLGAIIISSIEVHRLRTAPPMQNEQPYTGQPTMVYPPNYGQYVGQPPQVHVYPSKMQ